MTDRTRDGAPVQRGQQGSAANPYGASGRPQPANLADLLERVLDKGVVLAGDIRVNLLDIELLTIKIRLLLVSVDKAEEMGIDWWRTDPMLSSAAAKEQSALRQENVRLQERLDALEGRSTDEVGGSTNGQASDVEAITGEATVEEREPRHG